MTNPRPKYMQLAKARLDWARHRIDEFIVEADAFLSQRPSPYVVIKKVQREGDTGHITFEMRVNKKPLRTLRFRAGDAIHNLRATVDSLVYGLAQLNNSMDNLGLQFYETEARFLARYAQQIKCLPVEIQDWIAKEQPHNRSNGPSLLHTLNRMWNADKHRSTALMAGAMASGAIGTSTSGFFVQSFRSCRTGGLENGDKIALATLPMNDLVHFQPDFMLDLSFSKKSAADGAIVRTFLSNAYKHILNEVIPRFEPFL
jgi:hypothetical protein